MPPDGKKWSVQEAAKRQSLDESSPHQVTMHAGEQVKRLRESIKATESLLARQKSDLAEWERIAGKHK